MSEHQVAVTPNDSDVAASAGQRPEEIRIAIFVCFLNAGMSTRGVEIAKALRKLDSGLNIRLFSWKGPESITYEHVAKDCDITYYGNEIDKETWTGLLKAEHSGTGGLLHDKTWMKKNIEGALQAMKDFSPTVVVHGAIPPDAAFAAQILNNIPDVLFGPIPMWDTEWVESLLCQDIPDAQATWWTDLLPLRLRQGLMHYLFRRRRLIAKSAATEAAIGCGWTPKGTSTLIVTSEYYILTDLASNYNGFEMGSNVKIVGPIFAKANESDAIDDDIRQFLSLDAPNKVFVTMGSTGGKEFVIEAVKATCDSHIPTLVALVPSRCSIQDLRDAIGTIPSHVTLTERFVPANVIATQVNIVVGHGGQGTVQTALASGTPILGVAMQWEQQFNLDNAVRQGAAIRIDKRKWKSNVIKEVIKNVLEDANYQESALRIQKEMEQTHGADSAARFVLDVARSR